MDNARPDVVTRSRARRGLTIPELIIGLAVFGLVAVLVVKGAQPVFNYVKDLRHSRYVTLVAQAVINGNTGRPTLGTSAIALSKYVNDRTIDADLWDGTGILNGFGGYIAVTGNGANEFFVDSSNLSLADCLRAMTYGWEGGILRLGVGTNLFNVGTVTDANAATACAGATNTVRFVWSR